MISNRCDYCHSICDLKRISFNSIVVWKDDVEQRVYNGIDLCSGRCFVKYFSKLLCEEGIIAENYIIMKEGEWP